MYLSHLITYLIDLGFEGIYSFFLGRVFPRVFREKTISLEQIETFLDFSSLTLVKGKLFFWDCLLTFLEVYWIDVENTNHCQQKDTYILGIYLEIF